MARPKFFKLVDEDTINDRRMTLPLKIGNTFFRYPNHPGTVVVYISTALTWVVNVAITIEGNVNHGRPVFTFYGAGWEQFARHTTLMIGSEFLFELDAMTRLKARVFNMSGSEVTNPDTLNQVWTVEAKKATHRPEMNLSTGWRIFMRDNNIRIGDQCEFEIVANGPPCVLRVVITRPMA
ncbi:hypothetical protein LINPERPRIM_LOCUS118 [Linum perenne]